MYAEHDKKNIIIHLIGHSRGATIACYVALDRKCWKIENGVFEITPEMKEKMRMIVYRDDIGKVALLSGGTYPVSYNTHQFIRDKFCSIMGDNDGYLLFGDRDVRVRSRHSLVPSDKSTCLSLATFFKKHTGSTATVEFGGEVEETYPQHCVIQ